jgi:membrane protein DedA with SNARE-associated domain/membrane-associated phospholipid phosphatase
VVAAAVAVAVAAIALHQRRRLGRGRLVLALVIAAVLGVYATGLTGRLPDAKKVIEGIAGALGPYTYVLVGGLAFLETGAFVGLIAPGETALLVGGVVAGHGEVNLFSLIAIVWVAAALGDTTSFFIGRRLGRGFLLRHGRMVGITEPRLEQVERYFERHGGKTILIGRFIGLVRALAPFIAGSSGLAYRRFVPYSILGAGAWAALFCTLGYIFWRSFDRVAKIAGQATFAFGLVVSIVVGVVYAVRRLRRPGEKERLERWLERQEQRPALRPLFAVGRPIWRRVLRPVWRVALPQLRFLWARLTPGGLGLEFTTALAVAVGGLYAFGLLTAVVNDHPEAFPLDRTGLDLARDLRTGTMVDAAKLVTQLGSPPVAGAVVAAAAALLATRRRWPELAALLAGAVLVYLAVHITKAAVDRPRPAGGLMHARGSSYPSAHAAYSTVWIAAALSVTRVLSGLARETALVLAGIVIAAVVGLTRVYLHVHYPTDVAGGWALGVGLFGASATIALVVAHIRQNSKPA